MPETTFQPAETAASDTYIWEGAPAVNYGNNVQLKIGHQPAVPENNDTLINWDLSSIPTGSQIEEAKLSLYCEAKDNQLCGEIGITAILVGNLGWTELGCTWNTKDGAAAWAGGTGCDLVGVDFNGNLMWGYGASPAGTAAWHHFDLDPLQFQGMFDNNYGMLIRHAVRAGGVRQGNLYSSSSCAVAAQYPKLYVLWTEPVTRLIEYFIDVWDPSQNIRDSQGRIVPPDEVEANKWIQLIGAGTLSSRAYDTLVEDPLVSYIESASYRADDDRVVIRASKESMLQAFLKRLGGVSS